MGRRSQMMGFGTGGRGAIGGKNSMEMRVFHNLERMRLWTRNLMALGGGLEYQYIGNRTLGPYIRCRLPSSKLSLFLSNSLSHTLISSIPFAFPIRILSCKNQHQGPRFRKEDRNIAGPLNRSQNKTEGDSSKSFFFSLPC